MRGLGEVIGKWCVWKTLQELSKRKQAATKELVRFCKENDLIVASSQDYAKGGRRGHAPTWRLPGQYDGKTKMVGLEGIGRDHSADVRLSL